MSEYETTDDADSEFEPLNTRDTQETTRTVPNSFNRVKRDEITPDRLDNIVNYDLFDQYEEFEHRVERVNVHMLVGYLANVLIDEDAEFFYGDEPAEIIVDALEERFPTWFVDSKNLAGELISEFYVSARVPAESPISTEWSSMAQVILPMVALLLAHIEEQMEADAARAKVEAKDEIKNAINNLAFEHRDELTTEEFREVVKDGLDKIPEEWSF